MTTKKPAFEYRLTERRKADREQMAREVEALAARMGWRSERCEYAAERGDAHVRVTGPQGLSCSIEFERHTALTDHYCMPWHFNLSTARDDAYARLSDQFGRFQGSAFEGNHHRRKCTAFAGGIDQLLDKLEVAMEMANGTSAYGSAFMIENT